MPQTPQGRYAFAEVGETNWHKDEGPENIWSQQENEIIWYGQQSERPDSGVEGRKFFSVDSRILWYDDGDAWSAIAGLGSSNQFIPATGYMDAMRVESPPTNDLDVARKEDLDELEASLSGVEGFAPNPHGDSSHSEDYLKSGEDEELNSLTASRVRVDVLEFEPQSSDPTPARDASMWFRE